LDLEWRTDRRIRIMNMYANNETDTHREMWTKILEWTLRHADLKPDVMLGDFNMVETLLD
jgi:hypothetical protein